MITVGSAHILRDAGVCADQGERSGREGNHAGAGTEWQEARPPGI